MAIPTRQSLAGFVVSDPELSTTRNSNVRVQIRVGTESWRRNEDGTFTQTGTVYSTLALYDRVALKAYKLFEKGDRFVAEGHVHTYQAQVEGQTRDFEEFVARKIGHDVNHIRYRVDRTPPERAHGREQGPAASAGAESPHQPADAVSATTTRQQSLPPVAEPGVATPAQRGEPVSM